MKILNRAENCAVCARPKGKRMYFHALPEGCSKPFGYVCSTCFAVLETAAQLEEDGAPGEMMETALKAVNERLAIGGVK